MDFFGSSTVSKRRNCSNDRLFGCGLGMHAQLYQFVSITCIRLLHIFETFMIEKAIEFCGYLHVVQEKESKRGSKSASYKSTGWTLCKALLKKDKECFKLGSNYILYRVHFVLLVWYLWAILQMYQWIYAKLDIFCDLCRIHLF
ncbi:hypothetical protein Hdeb2414_s0004g00139531 [Helianthus debilis subsp. tardiflorus]